MSESVQEGYRVILHEKTGPKDLGEMTETHLGDFLGIRGVGATEVFQELERKGETTAYFDYAPLGPRAPVEIRRVPKTISAR